ncbi:MAG: coenzyme F420 hydrogenase subunit beta, partial [Promethearchaeota archaeon]
GSQGGHSSVITRSKEGDEVFKGAADAGLIEYQSLKDVKPGQGLLERIAASKRKNCKPIVLENHKNS